GRDRREAAHGGVGGTSHGRKTNRTEDQADRERIRRRATIRGCSRAYGDALRYRRSQICDCANVCINDPDFVDSFLDRFSRRRVFGLFVLVPTRLKALLSLPRRQRQMRNVVAYRLSTARVTCSSCTIVCAKAVNQHSRRPPRSFSRGCCSWGATRRSIRLRRTKGAGL